MTRMWRLMMYLHSPVAIGASYLIAIPIFALVFDEAS